MCDKAIIIGNMKQDPDPELVPTFYLRDEGGDVLVKRKDDQGDSRFVAMFFQDPHDPGQARELAEDYVKWMNRKKIVIDRWREILGDGWLELETKDNDLMKIPEVKAWLQKMARLIETALIADGMT